jgi:hypothetical protein
MLFPWGLSGRSVELYLHSPIRLYGVVLSWSTGAPLPLLGRFALERIVIYELWLWSYRNYFIASIHTIFTAFCEGSPSKSSPWAAVHLVQRCCHCWKRFLEFMLWNGFRCRRHFFMDASYPMGTGALPLGVKRPEREADHSLSCRSQECLAIYLQSYNTPSWCGAYLKHRDNFTSYLYVNSYVFNESQLKQWSSLWQVQIDVISQMCVSYKQRMNTGVLMNRTHFGPSVPVFCINYVVSPFSKDRSMACAPCISELLVFCVSDAFTCVVLI